MSALPRLASAALLAAAATGLVASPSHAASAHHHNPFVKHAVFVQNDDPNGNAITAYDRTASGGLVEAGSYPTGGLGGVLAGSQVDHLASEGSLAYDRASQRLFAVNAGSDSITVFSVHGDRLSREQVIGSGGSFPVSVTVDHGRVFVLNARDGGSVQGFVTIGGRLVRVPAWHRGLGLDPEQTPEFTSTPGQIGFTPDGRQVVVTTKNGGNSILVFRPSLGRLGAPTETDLPGTVPFGFDFDARGDLAVTEAGPNAVATFGIRHDGTLTVRDSAATGQAATCWVIATGNTLYASNAGSGSVSTYRVGSAGSLSALGNVATDGGTVDATVSSDGGYLYVQTGATGTVDAYRVHHDGSLTATGSVVVPNAVGGEGIVAL
ncbi:MAG: beta-propeller fold lactonase family protein [Nocardioides sp.]